MSFHDLAQQAIVQSGGRMTGQRRLILDTIASGLQQWDAETLFSRVQQKDSSLSLATVYRTLRLLEESGLVRQRYISSEHERSYYELIHTDDVYHFTCRECRRVIPFRSELIENLKTQLQNELGVSVFHACVCFDGLCPDCRAKEQGDS